MSYRINLTLTDDEINWEHKGVYLSPPIASLEEAEKVFNAAWDNYDAEATAKRVAERNQSHDTKS